LKKLTISFQTDIDYNKKIEVGAEFKCWIFFGDEKDEGIDYKKNFPLLQSLTFLYPNYVIRRTTFWWSRLRPIFDLFFPLNGEKKHICKTLKYLNVPYFIMNDKTKAETVICPMMEEISTCFPNVHNKWINQTRSELASRSKKRKFDEQKEANANNETMKKRKFDKEPNKTTTMTLRSRRNLGSTSNTASNK
jgi:hypothetical protein